MPEHRDEITELLAEVEAQGWVVEDYHINLEHRRSADGEVIPYLVDLELNLTR